MLYARRHAGKKLMNTFLLHLQSATQYERIENVLSFVGEDDSGSFGILPGHARMMTLLGFGLARFRVTDQDWEFLALPGLWPISSMINFTSIPGVICAARIMNVSALCCGRNCLPKKKPCAK